MGCVVWVVFLSFLSIFLINFNISNNLFVLSLSIMITIILIPIPPPCHLIIQDNLLDDGFIEHLFVPILQPLRLGNLHVGRVAVEDVVITLRGGTCPDVSCGITEGGLWSVVRGWLGWVEGCLMDWVGGL